MEMSHEATMFVNVDVTDPSIGGDITGDDASMAFVPRGIEPADDDWHTADWTDTGTTLRVLVGPDGTVTLDEGLYAVWIKISDQPEQPVLRTGWLSIT